MRKLRVSMLVAGLMVLGAACSSEGGAEVGSGTPSDGSPAVSAAPVSDGPASEAPDTAAPTPPAAGDAACLQGTWLQGPDRMQAFLAQIGSPMTMTVLPDSVMALTVSGDSVGMVSTITLQATLADTTMQMTGNGNYSGTFSADGGTITVDLTSQDYTAGDWLITIDGQTAAAPGMTSFDPGPPINGVGTYTCTDTTLTVMSSGRTSTFDRG